MQPVLGTAEGHHRPLCPLSYRSLVSLLYISLVGRVGVCVTCVLARWLTDGDRVGLLHQRQHPIPSLWSRCTHLILGVGRQPPVHMFIDTRVCTGRSVLPSPPCFSRASHIILLLLSMAIELPVLLERLPNTLIGTPAMIKKKFQIRATMP